MKQRDLNASVPLGSLLDRYLAIGFIKLFALSLLCITAFYLVVDFFDRIDNLLKAGAPVWTSLRYFLYKMPVLISRVVGFAALFSTLFFLGTLSRHQEITAMRSSGLSLRRISLPLLACSLVIGVLGFFWSEGLVPVFTRKAQYIYKTEVQKKQPRSLLGTEDIWIRGEDSFIRVDRFDAKANILLGVSVFLLNRDFSLRGVIEAARARWDGTHWDVSGATEWTFHPGGTTTQRKRDIALPLAETPEDLKIFVREPEEFSIFELKKQISDLKSKGLNTTEYEVDLQVKFALTLLAPLLVLLGIPFALGRGPGGGMALAFGLSLLVGLGYWFVMAFSVSLGHSGAVHPWIAAWVPNLSLGLVGLFFALGQD
ncbi:MAG: LPS export ABC transporter permease LptG [Deltaproteobacteria bacterium]|nr:LPS export ABC transporter permease LptG [Deltaproteobacteria bacterium]